MLGYMFEIVLSRELGKLRSVRGDHSNLSIVEIDLVIRIDQTHVIGLVGVVVRGDHLHIVIVFQDNVTEKRKTELAKFERSFGSIDELLPIFFC